jgi:hypothetical protein
MAERRRGARFALAVPADVQLHVPQDIAIETTTADEVTVLSATPGVRGEDLLLRIGPSDAVQMTVAARTISSQPVPADGRLMHRLRLAMTGAIALSAGAQAAANSWRSGDRSTAMFVRTHDAQVTNLGRGGCLLELSNRLAIGTVATLHVGSLGSGSEPVRVSFHQTRRGLPRPHLAGVQFLSLAAPSSRSLRAMAGRLEAEHDGLSLAGAGEESGLSLTNSVSGPLDILSIVCAAMGSNELPQAPLRSSQGQPRHGSPLALVGRRMTTPSAHETFGSDD